MFGATKPCACSQEEAKNTQMLHVRKIRRGTDRAFFNIICENFVQFHKNITQYEKKHSEGSRLWQHLLRLKLDPHRQTSWYDTLMCIRLKTLVNITTYQSYVST